MSETDLTNNEALTLLYREHHSWLLNWLRKRLDCRMQAEDHAHDTFMRILAARDPYAIVEPRAYLTTIAALPEALAPSPEQHIIILATLQEIDALLDQLPAKVRSAFLMSQLDGLTYVEIGQRLGVSDRMVKKYMAGAMLHCLTAEL